MKNKKAHRIKLTLTTKSISLSILGLTLILILLVTPDTLFNDNVGFCLHKKIFGFDCPGCGMTRAIHSVLHLDFLSAADFNYAVFGLFPLLITQTVFQLTDSPELKIIRTIVLYVFIALLSSIYISRIIGYI